MDRLVVSFARLTKDARMVGATMSALIGLLPMPGGALFSAPMVESSFTEYPITSEQKTALNYWFRHIWEYWWPLYPGVVLAVALLDVETWRFMAVMAPMTLVSVLAGSFFILRPLARMDGNNKGNLSWSRIKTFLWELMPILIVVLVIILLAVLTVISGTLGFNIKIPGAISLLPGLIASIIWVCVVNHTSFRQFRSAVINGNILPMIFLIIAIMIFQGIMTKSGAVIQIRNELMAYKVPVILVIIAMPFLSGLVTGIAIGFVGASFPLIIPMFQTGNMIEYLSFAALAYTFGYMGMMLSPVHLCFLVTKDYFKASFLNSYRLIMLPALTVMLIGVILFLIIDFL